MKILWLTNIPSPYRIAFFEILGKDCDLTVLFERTNSSERNSSWGDFSVSSYKAIFLKGFRYNKSHAFCPSVLSYLRKDKYDHIVISNPSSLTGIISIVFSKLFSIPYEIETDGGFPGVGFGLKEKFKKWLLKSSQRYFSTAKIHDDYYLTYGADKNAISRYPFTSLHEDDVLNKPPSYNTKKKIREELCIHEELVILCVGQFIYRKGIDLLIRSSSMLDNTIGIYIIGGSPSLEYLELSELFGKNRVHFVDFQQKIKLRQYYQAADVFVFPTREDIWGLVVNEAMANGLPVITTNKCVAGLELVNDQNGRLIPVDSVSELGNAINEVLSNKENRERMAMFSIKKIRPYTLENMAKIHFSVWKGSDS